MKTTAPVSRLGELEGRTSCKQFIETKIKCHQKEENQERLQKVAQLVQA